MTNWESNLICMEKISNPYKILFWPGRGELIIGEHFGELRIYGWFILKLTLKKYGVATW
jgi:hypothetical protein